jgi:hypothetical protein
MGSSVVILYRLALEWPGLEVETSASHGSELFAFCVVAMPRMSFSWRYTLYTPLTRGMSRVSKSAATVATILLSLAKVGHDTPSWLLAAAMALPGLGPW